MFSLFRPVSLCRHGHRLRSLHYSAALFAKKKSLKTFHLADIGEGITECEVLKWSIKPPSRVGLFDPLCEVQSDKATVEITSPFDGVIKELLVQEGFIAKVGEGLCVIEVEEDSDSATSSDQPASAPTPATTPTAAPETRSATEGSYTPPSPSRRHHPLDPARPAESLSAVTGQRAEKQKDFGKSGNQALATPSIRHYARSQGISDLDVLMPGSGRGGRIERADIDAYLKRAQKSETSAATPAKRDLGEEIVIEMGRTRWGMWKSMTKSLEVPLFGYSATLDLTALNDMLPILNAHIPQEYRPPPPAPEYAPSISPDAIFSGAPDAKQTSTTPSDPASHFKRMTMLPLLLKTLSLAMMEWPVMRTHINPTAEPSAKPTLTIRPSADISIALSTPSGLYTPTLVGLNNHSPYAIAGSLARLAYLGRQTPSGLTVADMPKRGGTLTVSNVGAVGAGKWAVPRLVQGGGVAIVAVGRADWVVKPSGEKRLEVGVSWSADHRVVEGAELAAFVESWRSWVENPARLVGVGQ
ncbi:2-oxoisovalerate dehydrogenase E2 component (dihydrolipoyl transacylase) [Rhizoctonia solani]|uniref:Dihydrolipoamide acetyltransferase component of pyruvate dehydrogenase complex n=1 Tax=Rhizoctonia solani TaxID=456999 RepID=A0A0K6FYN2_9AGAM|nr:2-oxoisovalerate dehydrogenase E2 component (dihydrolipoyl transacylase) [Rhizoctonia solani]